MYIKTTAEVNEEHLLVINENYRKKLRPGMKVRLVIEEEQSHDQQSALENIIRFAQDHPSGIKSEQITREWIHEQS